MMGLEKEIGLILKFTNINKKLVISYILDCAFTKNLIKTPRIKKN